MSRSPEAEAIPDEDHIFRWVPANRINARGQPAPGAFKERGSGMSTDWSKYSTAKESQDRAQKPELTGIARLEVEEVRRLGLGVTHTPRDWNRAHTDVTGIGDDEELRLLLRDMARMVLVPLSKS